MVKETKIPEDLKKALTKNPKIRAKWDDITPISKRDFVSWIKGAKQKETRERRIKVTCSKLESGKRRPCCYAVVPMGLYRILGANPKAKNFWSKLTADEKRNFSDYVNEAKDVQTREIRINKATAMLAGHKKGPFSR